MKTLISSLIGAGLGYGYYLLVGCPTGGCPITSNPWNTMAYGALMGFILVFPGFQGKKKDEAPPEEENVDSETPPAGEA